jgi:hypothetical protein
MSEEMLSAVVEKGNGDVQLEQQPETPVDAPDVVDGESVETSDESTTEQQPDQDAQPVNQEPHKKDRVQQRINQLVKQREQERIEKERLRGELEAYKNMNTRSNDNQGANSQYVQHGEKPQRDNYDSDEAYIEAIADYKAEAKFVEIERRREQQRVKQQVATKFDEASKKYDDWEEVVAEANYIPSTPAMAEAIATSENVADVFYYLAKNPSDAKRIASLSPIAAAREIGRIDARLSNPEKPKEQPIQKTTAAPRPARTVAPSGSAPVVKSPDQMTPDEYYRWRFGSKK